MMQSLNSGISGLSSLQSEMNVIGNNISNVSTTGYKASRITFQDALSQTLNGATAPGAMASGLGGTNPLQMGLGVGIGSIDTQFGQGNLQTTGNTTDLAIQGSAFFVVANGPDNSFTRDGSFSLDADGHLVMPGSGLILQGYNADGNGVIPPTAVPTDLTIPYNTQAPAKATTKIDFSRNLNSNSAADGTVTTSARFLAPTDGTLALTSLSNAQGQPLLIQATDNLTFSAQNVGTGNTVTATFPVVAGTTLNQLATSLQTFLSTTAGSAGTTVAVNPATGQLQITAGATAVSQLQVSSVRPTSDSLVANAFSFPSTIASGGTKSSEAFLRPAAATDLLSNVVDSNGNALGLATGDTINVSGSVGGAATTQGALAYTAGTTTMGDLLASIQNQFKLPQTDGTLENNPTVSLNAPGAADNMPEGVIVVRGLPGTAFALTNLSIQATDPNPAASAAPANFNANLGFTQQQKATDAGAATTSITAYDANGAPHNISVTFTKSQVANQWYWNATVAGSEQVVSGGSGKITFGADGTVSSFTFDDNAGKLTIDPKDGAVPMAIDLNPGSSGQFTGLTQFDAANTAAATNQDGHTMGSLQSISIGTDGIITGQFSNGVTQSLAQVEVADFTNPEGLTKQSNSVFGQSPNSGEPVYGRPGSQSTSTIASGSLEGSNVDLAAQLTEMITTQQAYSANAKVITTSSQMLQTLNTMGG
ncbi:MAG TPA: flagellar hook-basal body complex protein [Fibrobacteria bacterium]|nr:flagellar hook-basal body complex protein [Fibrobacteria bacterium]